MIPKKRDKIIYQRDTDANGEYLGAKTFLTLKTDNDDDDDDDN